MLEIIDCEDTSETDEVEVLEVKRDVNIENQEDDGDNAGSSKQSQENVPKNTENVISSEFLDITEEEYIQLRKECQLPLALRLRPKDLNDYIGQVQLIGEEGSVSHYFKDENINKIRSLILWGPPGIGKTSLAKIIISKSKLKSTQFSATLDSIDKIKQVIKALESKRRYILNEDEQLKNRMILFIDEIHRFNKNQQDYLLDLVDRNLIVLIGATTENPSMNLTKALCSRCLVLTLVSHTVKQISQILLKGINLLNKTRRCIFHFPEIHLTQDAIEHIAKVSNGDLRNALKILEMAFVQFTKFDEVTKQVIDEHIELEAKHMSSVIKKQYVNFDQKGENHYDAISALHKSIRGSDVNAALYYACRILNGGDDPLFVCRRMIRMASEDIGVANSKLLPYTTQVYESVLRFGLPKCYKLILECIIKLAESPKSIEIYRAINTAKDIAGKQYDIKIPPELTRDAKIHNSLNQELKLYSFLPESLQKKRVLLERHLGLKEDEELHVPFSDSETEFSEEDFYKRKKRRISDDSHREIEGFANSKRTESAKIPTDQLAEEKYETEMIKYRPAVDTEYFTEKPFEDEFSDSDIDTEEDIDDTPHKHNLMYQLFDDDSGFDRDDTEDNTLNEQESGNYISMLFQKNVQSLKVSTIKQANERFDSFYGKTPSENYETTNRKVKFDDD